MFYILGMFIKKVIKTDRKTKKIYFSYHLIESVRTYKGPRHRVLLYMGSQIDLPDGDLKILAERIEDIITGQTSCISYPENIEKLAHHYASQVIQRLSERKDEQGNTKNDQPEFISIDVNSIEKSEPRTVGAEHLMLQMANQLQLPQKLQKIGLSKTDASIALASIIARAVMPNSERATYKWLCNKSGLGELLDFNFKNSSLNKLYQVSDQLLTNKTSLEEHLEMSEQTAHDFQSTIALYDLTNTYMEGQAKGNSKAQFGFSKEKRFDCPLVTMGLVMNEHGFLNRTAILPGNASEPKSLEDMIKSLDSHSSLFKPIIILDAGIASDNNLKWLGEHRYKYVVSARQDAPSMELEGDLVPVGDSLNLVKAALIKNDYAEEKWLYCESEAKAAVAAKMKHSFRQRFEEDLQKLKEGITKKKGRKNYIKILERLGRLKEKHKRISGCYEVTVHASEDGKNAIAIDWKILDEKMNEKLTGYYFLRTNLIDMEAKDLWQLYNTLRRVEDAFRFMKSSLGLRPIYHQKERRVDGHLWITILAYHLIQNCLFQLKNQGVIYDWKTIREIIMNRSRVTTEAKTVDGKKLYHRSTTKPEQEQVEIYKALGLSSQILKAKKIIL